MDGVREQTTLLGPRKSLVGIIAQDPARAAVDRPAVVILNAGIIHRVGPNRMFVELSRALAAAGHTVVRFDLAGIGDSEARCDGLPPVEAALADIREVLDSLQAARQLQRFMLIGLCSGADQAAIYAGEDPRVVGVVLIDPFIPRTPRYYVNHYSKRVFRLQSWRNFTAGRHPFWHRVRQLLSPAVQVADDDERSEKQETQVRRFLESAYRRLVQNSVELLAVFTGAQESQLNYREQLLDAFPGVRFGKLLRLEYFESSDHTFTSGCDRVALRKLILEWVGTCREPQSSGASERCA